MLLHGIDVEMQSHYCFERRHASCFGLALWQGADDYVHHFVPCECRCHR